jgi:hypothetical protein
MTGGQNEQAYLGPFSVSSSPSLYCMFISVTLIVCFYFSLSLAPIDLNFIANCS